ncbi:MAG: peptidoglycan DD-metalloendopeptidase family protein [Proteobacteria bacterium]|nr:peptidoglycan DD-metalloendopeptidase family protein [Pseudomonadota bacterium]
MTGQRLRVWRRIWDWIVRMTPERQFLYRSQGVVRVLNVGRKAQIGATAGLVVLFAWMTFSTVQVVLRDQIIDAKDNRIAQVTRAYNLLERRAQQAEDRFRAITGELETQHAQLVELLAHRSRIESQLEQVRGVLDATVGERDEARLENNDLRNRVEQLGADLINAGATNRTLAQSLADAEHEIFGLVAQRDQAIETQRNLTRQVAELTDTMREAGGIERRLTGELGDTWDQLAVVTSERDEAVVRSTQLDEQIAALTDRLETAARRNNALAEDVAATGQMAAALQLEREEALRSRDFLASLVDELEYRLADLKDSQGDMILRLQESATASATAVAEVVEMTGLPVEALLAGDLPGGPPGQGGPVMHVGGGILDNDQAIFLDAVSAVEAELDRWQSLESLLAILPLVAPADNYYISSTFGERRDPFTRRLGMHYGLDMAGPFDSDLRAPAPGIVTRAGYWGAYGRMIEIDHGRGIVTRYGHMNKIAVEKGQWIEFRDKIGTMGRSGRATGSHVHFEVLFNGEPVDPANFLKAGQYVFKVNGE